MYNNNTCNISWIFFLTRKSWSKKIKIQKFEKSVLFSKEMMHLFDQKYSNYFVNYYYYY